MKRARERTVDLSISGGTGAAATQTLHLQLQYSSCNRLPPAHLPMESVGSIALRCAQTPFGANHPTIETERRAEFPHGKATEVTAQNRDPAPKPGRARVNIAMPQGTRGDEAVSHFGSF